MSVNIINLLPENIANHIAAGEVVQRPASVVKELLENSVDAGATRIELHIREAGKSLIQVSDDGKGMSDTDALMCFERHATSKISTLEDIYRVRSFGFRGEALASIAAVAQVELRTARKDDSQGNRVLVEGGARRLSEPAPPAPGTIISVRNLFFNTPARRAFLKSNAAEYRAIHEEFIHVALAWPGVAFSFKNEEDEVYRLTPGSLRHRIGQLFGKKYDKALVPVQEEVEGFGVAGFVGKKEIARRTRGEQYFFANERYIRNTRLNYAVRQAYGNLLSTDEHPFYCLFISIDPQKIDINVHPTKTEIKFEDENMAFAIVQAAVKHSLGRYQVAPGLDFDPTQQFTYVPYEQRSRPAAAPPQPGGGNYNPFRGTKAGRDEWQALHQVLTDEARRADLEATAPEVAGANVTGTNAAGAGPLNVPESVQPIIQVQGRYIVTTIRSGMVLIHQQRAHERVLYEAYLRRLAGEPVASQPLLFPEPIHLASRDYAAMLDMVPELNLMGYSIENFGPGTLLIQAVPTGEDKGDYANMMERILLEWQEAGSPPAGFRRQEAMARALASRHAIQTGTILSPDEMRELADRLFGCAQPEYGIHRLPTFILMDAEEIEKRFSGKR